MDSTWTTWLQDYLPSISSPYSLLATVVVCISVNFFIYHVQKYAAPSSDPASHASSRFRVGLGMALIAVCFVSLQKHLFRSPTSGPGDEGTDSFHLADIDVSAVLKQNLRMANHSWEHGVLTHALLELQNPELTVFAGPGYGIDLKNPYGGRMLEAFPDGKLPKCGGGGTAAAWGRYDEWTRVKGLRYAASKIVTERDRSRVNGSWLYREDAGTASDAASLGWAALLLERAGAVDPANPVGAGRNAYGEAVTSMVEYLFVVNSRFKLDSSNARGVESYEADLPWRDIGQSEGRKWAISHRDGYGSSQLWADSVFMVPVFLSAYAVARQDERWLWEAVEQIKAYERVLVPEITEPDEGREDLREPTAAYNMPGARHPVGLWMHVVAEEERLGDGADHGLWLTGNAWVLAGMTRVLGVLQRWSQTAAFSTNRGISQAKIEQRRVEAQEEVRLMANRILSALRPAKQEIRMLENYADSNSFLDQEYGNWAFGDAAGTALIASSVYRLAQIGSLNDMSMLHWADGLYNLVADSVNDQGVLSPVTTVSEVPANHAVLSGTSEGQSFAIMMFAARRDCARIGRCKSVVKQAWWRRLMEM